jgi:hypothetical protein
VRGVQGVERLLGNLAVRQGYCTREQVDECLRMQSMIASAAPLGDLLVFKGYLTAPQLKELLSHQHKKLMACSCCALSFTVLTLSDGKPIRCPKCRGFLVERTPEGPTKSDAEFATRIVPPVRPLVGPRLPQACIICDASFEAAEDASGRVQCPVCHSTFTSNRIP